jgi:hypothetical protein
VREYAKALGVRFGADDLAALDRDYPPPDRDGPLETI